MRYVVKICLIAAVFAFPGCGKQRGDAHFVDGMEALKNSHYEKAIDELTQASQQMPDSSEVLCNLGIAYWQTGKHGEAIGAFKKAHDIAALETIPLEYMGIIFLEVGNVIEARNAFTDALKIIPDNPRILNALAALEYKSGNINLAYEGFKKATDVDPKFAPAYYNLGRLYADKVHNTQLATRNFNRFQQLAGNDPLSERAKARITGVAVTAQPVLHIGTEPSNSIPANVDDAVRKAMKSILDENYDDALVILGEYEPKHPDRPDIIWYQAVIYDRHVPSRDKAIERYRKFMAKFPQDHRCKIAADRLKILDLGPVVSQEMQESAQKWFEQGVNAHGKSDTSQAIACYREAVRLNPAFVSAWFNLGLIYYESGESSSQARKAFEKVINLKPEMVKAYYMIAMIVKAEKGNSAALEVLKSAVSKDPNYGKAYYMMGVIYREDGRPDLARDNFEKFLALAPDDQQAATVRVWLNSGKGKTRLPR